MMAKKKQETAEGGFYETASKCIKHLAKVPCWDATSAAMTSSVTTLSLSVMAVAEQLRIANLLSLAEAGGTHAGDAAWQEITGSGGPDDAEGFAPWVAQALGIETREEGDGDE